jgi:hypothetical protein
MLNIGVTSTFAIVVGSILMIVIRGTPTKVSAMEMPVVPDF